MNLDFSPEIPGDLQAKIGKAFPENKDLRAALKYVPTGKIAEMLRLLREIRDGTARYATELPSEADRHLAGTLFEECLEVMQRQTQETLGMA